MNICLFAYNFPHKKTQDFLFRLLTDGIKPCLVLAQDWMQLNIPTPTLRVKPRHTCLIHPRDICDRFDINYYVVNHNSEECHQILKRNNIDIGIISGARILKKPTIQSVEHGIINFHLGLIPEHRGLDGLQWSILNGLPLGVTAHVIDERVDAGWIIARKIIKEFPDDTFIDLSLRLHETQLCMLAEVIERFCKSSIECFEPVEGGSIYRRMHPEAEARLPQLLARRLGKLGEK